MMKKLLSKDGNGELKCAMCSSHLQIFGILLLVSLFFVFGTLAAYLFQKTRISIRQDIGHKTITIVGEGSVSARPTVALVQAGLETTGKTVQEAVDANTQKMNAFLATLPSFGIEERDRKTMNYSIQPKYEYPKEPGMLFPGPTNPVLVGYTVLNTVQIKVRNLEKAGDVLASIGSHGLNQVGSFSFGIDDMNTIKGQAMEAALANAQEKVARFERSTGSKVGGIITFFETVDGIPPMPFPNAPMALYEARGKAAPTVEMGENEVKATVNVTYEVLR